jgi:hypothetical protein
MGEAREPETKVVFCRRPLKMEPIRSPETSARNQPTLRNIPEDDRIQANSSESLRSCKGSVLSKIVEIGKGKVFSRFFNNEKNYFIILSK